MQKMWHQRGVTFIELILVVSIILTLSIMSTVFYSRFLMQDSVEHAIDQLVGSLRKAQLYSMMSRYSDSWSVAYSANKVYLFKGVTFATRTTAYDEVFDTGGSISVSGISSSTVVSFNRGTGSRVTGDPASVVTITVSGGTHSESIFVNGQGMVTR